VNQNLIVTQSEQVVPKFFFIARMSECNSGLLPSTTKLRDGWKSSFWHTILLNGISTTIRDVHEFDYSIDIHLEIQEKNDFYFFFQREWKDKYNQV